MYSKKINLRYVKTNNCKLVSQDIHSLTRTINLVLVFLLTKQYQHFLKDAIKYAKEYI